MGWGLEDTALNWVWKGNPTQNALELFGLCLLMEVSGSFPQGEGGEQTKPAILVEVNLGEGEKGKSLVNVGFVWVCW